MYRLQWAGGSHHWAFVKCWIPQRFFAHTWTMSSGVSKRSFWDVKKLLQRKTHIEDISPVIKCNDVLFYNSESPINADTRWEQLAMFSTHHWVTHHINKSGCLQKEHWTSFSVWQRKTIMLFSIDPCILEISAIKAQPMAFNATDKGVEQFICEEFILWVFNQNLSSSIPMTWGPSFVFLSK